MTLEQELEELRREVTFLHLDEADTQRLALGFVAERDAAQARVVELEREVEGLRRRVAELVGERDRAREARAPLGGEPTLFEEVT